MIEFRLSDFIAPKRLLHWRWKLWQSQYYSPEQQHELQWKLFSKLLDHCFANVPYYRTLFTDLGLHPSDFSSHEDLQQIPILTKEILFDRSDEFKADNFARYKPRTISTSGTTGTPLTVYWDIGSNILELTSLWRHFSWSGYRLGQPFLDIRSVLMDEPSGYKWNWKCQGLEMSSDIINSSNIKTYAAILRQHRVKLWRGHPSSIDSLCRLLDDAGIDDIMPKYIYTNSEALLGNQRKFIEAWSGVPVCDGYGLKEHNVFIGQCLEGGYHIASEYGIVEIIKDDGSVAMPGEEGKIIATSLHNHAFPLLRYDTGDFAIQSDRTCSCGRTLPLVDKLTGRIDDRIRTIDGRWVSGLHFAFFVVNGVRKAQLVQTDPRSLDVYLVPTEGYGPKVKDYLCNELRKKLGQSMNINTHIVQEVPYHSTQKFKFVINRLKDKEVSKY